MDIRKLQRAIVDGLEDVKAQNIVVFNTEHLSPLFERVIIASGTSNRQTKALASSVRETVKGRGMQVMRTEGEDNGEWIIVDCGAAVVHVMQPAIRDYYHLEEIWGDKPVKLKISSGEVKLVKASEEPAPAKKTAKTAAKTASKAPAKQAPAKAPAGKAGAAKTSSAKAPAAKKAAPAKKGVSRVVGAKTPAVKTVKVGAAKPAAKKTAPAKKAAPARSAPKPAAKKVVAKKAPAKTSAAKKTATKKA